MICFVAIPRRCRQGLTFQHNDLYVMRSSGLPYLSTRMMGDGDDHEARQGWGEQMNDSMVAAASTERPVGAASSGSASARSISLASPSGRPLREPSPPSKRRPSLNGQTVVLLDNGQAVVERPNYGDTLSWVAGHLKTLDSPAQVIELREILVTQELPALQRLAEKIQGFQPAGVVISICHAGVTAPSVMLAGTLERAGIPTVLICTPLGLPLARLMASYDVPDLPLVSTEMVTGLSEEARGEVARRVTDEVIRALTQPPRGNAFPDPAAGYQGSTLTSEAFDVSRFDDFLDLWENYWQELIDRRMSDGLPIVPPTRRRVEEMVAAAGRSEDEVVLRGPMPSQAQVTVGALAVNAVLAGCKPEYFPVVLAAVEAMDEPEFRFFQTAITTHPGGIAVVVSGPLAEALGLQSGAGCLGPGFRANASIGRAINLVLINVARSVPGMSSLATFGSPAQYSFCFAELREGNPWSTINEEKFDKETTTVTVLKCESPHNVISNRGPSVEALLDSAASVLSTLGTNGIRYPGDHLVLINPRHARMMAQAGYTKRDVQLYLYDKARVPADKFDVSRYQGRPWARTVSNVPVVRDPSEFHVIVAGGVGNQVMVAPTWGLSRAVTRPAAGP